MTALWIGVAGGLGSVARYLVGVSATRWLGARFPYGTLAVNVLGSIAIGLIFALAAGRGDLVDARTRMVITTGFLGGFTTYSAFAYDSLLLLERRSAGAFALYVGLTLAAGLAGCWLGVKLGRTLG